MPRRGGGDGRATADGAGEVLGDPSFILDGSIGLLVCDWNGTIVADADRACAATNATLTAQRLPAIDLPTFLATFSLPLDAFLQSLGVAEDWLTAAVRQWNAALAAQPTRLASGAGESLRTARALAIRAGVISAAATDAVAADVDALGIGEWLEFVVGSVTSKSARLEPLVHATRGSVLYVGDTEYDMTEALRAGALPVGVGNGYRPAAALLAAGATCVVPDLSILASLLAANPARLRG